jgi:hypothetical protein
LLHDSDACTGEKMQALFGASSQSIQALGDTARGSVIPTSGEKPHGCGGNRCADNIDSVIDCTGKIIWL